MQDYGLNQEGEPEDKTLNAHNCRKSGILSKMFVLHKVVTLFKEVEREELISEMV